MFGKKNIPKKEPDLSKLPFLPNDLAEHASNLAGLSSEEIVRLLEALERIDDSIPVSRRRPVPGKNTSKEVGGKQRLMSIEQAVEYEKKRIEERNEKEQKLKELYHIEKSLIDRAELNDEIYPKRLAPADMVRFIEAARERLSEEDRLKTKQSYIYSPREELLLKILRIVKQHEAIRVARKISERQRETVLGKTIEELEAEREQRIRVLKGIKDPAAESQAGGEGSAIHAEAEKEIERVRTLSGFDKNLRTLVDEAAEVTSDNIDAAAAVVRQWVGNVVSVEK